MHRAGMVYIVDDDITFRASLASLLRAAQLQVELFPSARAFLDRCDEELVRPSCLILDVCLPGVSGIELQAWLVERGVTLPIVFVSGYASVEVAVGAMKSGAVDYFEKPYDAAALLERIRRVIESDAESCQAQTG